MSKENLEQFMSKVADSEELQARIGEEIDTEALIALGAECGCEFTAEELQDSAELSDEELDGVAGGRRTGKERRADRKIIREIRKAHKNSCGDVSSNPTRAETAAWLACAVTENAVPEASEASFDDVEG